MTVINIHFCVIRTLKVEKALHVFSFTWCLHLEEFSPVTLYLRSPWKGSDTAEGDE